LFIFNFDLPSFEIPELAGGKMGLTGLEPVTLRLSSACSNQLSYRPGIAAAPRNFRISIADFRFGTTGAFRAHLLKSTIANRKSKIKWLAES
jgi:hypothetical protein